LNYISSSYMLLLNVKSSLLIQYGPVLMSMIISSKLNKRKKWICKLSFNSFPGKMPRYAKYESMNSIRHFVRSLVNSSCQLEELYSKNVCGRASNQQIPTSKTEATKVEVHKNYPVHPSEERITVGRVYLNYWQAQFVHVACYQ